jgi:putative membrane protein
MIDWTHWHNEPYLIGGLIGMAWLYALATGPLRARLAPGAPYPRGRAWCFYTALVLFYLAVGSPFDQIGERFLFSAHMMQHQILVYPVAVLWVVGLPPWLVDAVASRPIIRPIGYLLTRPIITGLALVLTQSIWHVPALYDLALQDRFVHVLEHLMFFGTAVLYWWPVLSTSKLWPPISLPGQMLYLVAVMIGMTPLFAFLTFSPEVLYPTYEYAPRLIPGFDPAEDQLVAGIIMKLGGIFMTFAAFAYVFTRWYLQTERREHNRQRTVPSSPPRATVNS